MELDFLTFSWAGVERKARRVNLSDYSAIREVIRRERLAAVPHGVSPEVLALVIAQPVVDRELTDYLFSVAGQCLIVYRCVNDVDQTFTPADAEAMVFADDTFPRRLYIESHLAVAPLPDELARGLLALGFMPAQIGKLEVPAAQLILELAKCPKQ